MLVVDQKTLTAIAPLPVRAALETVQAYRSGMTLAEGTQIPSMPGQAPEQTESNRNGMYL